MIWSLVHKETLPVTYELLMPSKKKLFWKPATITSHFVMHYRCFVGKNCTFSTTNHIFFSNMCKNTHGFLFSTALCVSEGPVNCRQIVAAVVEAFPFQTQREKTMACQCHLAAKTFTKSNGLSFRLLLQIKC